MSYMNKTLTKRQRLRQRWKRHDRPFVRSLQSNPIFQIYSISIGRGKTPLFQLINLSKCDAFNYLKKKKKFGEKKKTERRMRTHTPLLIQSNYHPSSTLSHKGNRLLVVWNCVVADDFNALDMQPSSYAEPHDVQKCSAIRLMVTNLKPAITSNFKGFSVTKYRRLNQLKTFLDLISTQFIITREITFYLGT